MKSPENNMQNKQISINIDIKLKPYNNYISSSSVFLRPLFASDWKAFSPIFTDPVVMQHFSNGQTMSLDTLEARVLSNAYNNILRSRSPYYWALITYEGIAGMVIVKQDKKDNTLISEMVYCIVPKCGGRGLTTEAAMNVIDYIGGNWCASVHPENIASRRVLEKLGFEKDDSRQKVFTEAYGAHRNYYILDTKEEALTL